MWIDSHNNLWIFGGENYGSTLNDLWKFDGHSWIWVAGSNSTSYGNYSVKGESSPTNLPASRTDFTSAIDSNNHLILFGGEIVQGVSMGFNDLWKFDGNDWAWISGGNDIFSFQFGNKGIPDKDNLPIARSSSASCMDSSDRFWIFGGSASPDIWEYFNYSSYSSFAFLNDLWMFDGYNWTWVSGSEQLNNIGEYGYKGVASMSYLPCCRKSHAMWIDRQNNIWIFGGTGLLESWGTNLEYFFDLVSCSE